MSAYQGQGYGRYESDIRMPRVDSTIGLRRGTHYANAETPYVIPGGMGRPDLYQHLNGFGVNALTRSQYGARFNPQAGLSYGDRPNDQLPAFNDGSTATVYGGVVNHPERRHYDINIPMSETLPEVDGLSGTVRNNYDNGEPDYDSPAYDQEIDLPQYQFGQLYGRNVHGVAYNPRRFPYEMEPVIPTPNAAGTGATDAVNIQRRAYNFTGVDQQAPISIIRTNQGGPGVNGPNGANSRKNGIYNAKLADIRNRGLVYRA